MQNNFQKIPTILSSLFLIFSFSVFLFFYREVKSNNQEFSLKELQWQGEISKRDEMKTLNNSIEIINAQRKQLETHFVQGSNVVPFFGSIEGLARKVSVKAEVASVNVLANNGGLMVGVKASGSFNDLYKFLTLLENSSYEIEIVGMDMKNETTLDAGSKNIATTKWNATFQIKLLSFIQ